MSNAPSPSAPSRAQASLSARRHPPHFSVLGMSAGARLGATLTMIAGLWAVVGWALDWFS